jgi:hypothetical protein
LFKRFPAHEVRHFRLASTDRKCPLLALSGYPNSTRECIF